jgi:hypothetical protein
MILWDFDLHGPAMEELNVFGRFWVRFWRLVWNLCELTYFGYLIPWAGPWLFDQCMGRVGNRIDR